MFTLKLDREPTGLETAIDNLLKELAGPAADSNEYAKMIDQLVKLHGLKTNESPRRPSPDALISALASIAGILLIVNFERVHVVTTKALGILPKVS
jgi:hypothetical protein